MPEGIAVWKRTDIILVSEKVYKDPYREVDIDAVFEHEDGAKISLYGFWNGGNEWRVRFAPTKPGIWNYTVTCSDSENAALNVSGSLTAVENDGPTDIDKHGFIKVSDNGRYFAHDDGTPFYWLGDTNWQAPNYVSVTECNYPYCGCHNQFRHEVADRLAKGFTVYQTYFDGAETDGGGQRDTTSEPSLWISRFDAINTAAFTEKIDKMFDLLADSGMVIALGLGVHASTTGAMPREDLDRFSRYITARYSAYPVVWITAQEITGEPQFDAWISSARVVDGGDGYGHPQSAHQFPLKADDVYVERLDGESWHDFYALQGGHGASITGKSVYKGYYDLDRSGKIKPFVETEANYEDITCGGFNGYSASRISAWKANLCGSCGFTYGATGVWANNYSTAGNTGWLGSYSFEPWYMGIDKPGSFEMKYLAWFFKYVDFSRLVPRFNDPAFSDMTAENKIVASSDNADTYVAYFYNGSYSAGTLRGLDASLTYSAKWYDPLTGCFVEIADDITALSGRYDVPSKPTKGDWVLLVTARTDLGTYPVEEPYRDSLITDHPDGSGNESGEDDAKKTVAPNVLARADAFSSTMSDEASSAARSIDGRYDTWWCASDGSFPQSLWFDMKEEREFDLFSMRMYPGTNGVSFTVETSSDGTHWREAGRTESFYEQKYAKDPVFSCRLDTPCAARYLRVTFTDVAGNWAAVVEACAYMSDGVNTAPAYAGNKIVPESVFCSGCCVYTADGVMTDTSYALFDGDPSTLWKPYAPIGSQTILVDAGSVRELRGINITVGENAAIPEYRIEGSVDGNRWRILADASLRERNIAFKDVVSEALSGSFRYLKILWLGTGNNSSNKTIAGIEIFAEDSAEGISEEHSETGAPETPADTGKDKKGMGSLFVPLFITVCVLAVCGLAGAAAATVFAVRKGKKKSARKE